MKKMIMMVLIMVTIMMVGCGEKPQQTAYVRAYDEMTGETIGYVCEVDGQLIIVADHERSDELVEMLQNEIENMN